MTAMTNNLECGCREYHELSRRRFMQLSAGAAVAGGISLSCLPRVALARDYRATQRDVMITVFLRGAADGLTMCVPYEEAAYYANRPGISIPAPGGGANAATDLDGFFGLPPAMLPLLPAYQDGNLLIVHAAGQQDSSRSHFDMQRFMEVGKANDSSLGTGWLGRHLYSVDPMDPNALLRAVGISTGLQKALVGAPNTLPIPDLDIFGLTGNAGTVPLRTDAIDDMYAATADPLHSAALTTTATIDLLNQINFSGYVPGGGAVYPNESFAYALKTSAALIRAQVGVEAIAIDIDGWDTHAAQGVTTGGMMYNLMNRLATGLAAFHRDLITGGGPGIVLTVYSEFGRRLLQNGTVGTDHGHGNAMFVLGQCVTGGRVLANWPGLDPGDLFEGRDLQVTTDYRDILAEIIDRRLGNAGNLPYIFPEYTPTYQNILGC
jgi:uncharacterized protein (DUF1501 family)